MILNKKQILGITLFSAVLFACQPNKDPKINKDRHPIVSVGENVLYKADLDNAIAEGVNAQDSANSADAYIKMWINDELIYDKAKQNVTDQARIDELVENYRQSLTVFTYLEELLKKELSKQLSDTELKEYYNNNPDKFKLESNIIKGLFLKVPRSSPELKNLKQWYKLNTETAKENIQKVSIQNTVLFDYFYDRWINVDEVLSNFPNPIGDAAQFVKSNKNFETQDSSYVYLLHIEAYVPIGGLAPYDYAKPQITDILINKHRESFLHQFEDDLYNKALSKEDIKYYIKRTKKDK